MSIRFPDTLTITPVTIDTVYGSTTSGTPFNSFSQIEFDSELSYSINGKPISPIAFIMLPSDTSIKKGDIINPVTIHGVDATTEQARDLEVKRVRPAGGMTVSHLEVFC